MKLLRPIIITIVSIALLAWLLPNIAFGGNWLTLIIAGAVLTLLQVIVKPLLKLLFLPINFVTLGLFSLVINVFVLWLATYFVPGFTIEPMIVLGLHLNQFFTLLFVSFLISLCQSAVGMIL